ncbi:MAG TPA: hypothetical protein VF779_19475 [Pyrinomonadaceae bacterium]
MRTGQTIWSLVAVTVLLVIALSSVACGKKSTPTETFKAFYEAAKKKDAAGIKKTLSKNLLGKLEEDAKNSNKPLDEYLTNVNLPDTLPETRNEKIDGDHATLEIKIRDDTWRPENFVKEDGEWKLDSR